MARYTLQELIQRANAGNIGYRGLNRLQAAGIDQGSIVHQGLGANQLGVDPQGELAARRASLYAHALQVAHDAPAGQSLSAGIQRRLALGAGGSHDFLPQNQQTAQQYQGDTYNTLLDSLKKRMTGLTSQAPIYRY